MTGTLRHPCLGSTLSPRGSKASECLVYSITAFLTFARWRDNIYAAEHSPAGLPLSFLNWAYVRQRVYFWAYGTPGVSIFGVFRTPSLPIFGVIFGLLEATKMYKLF